MREKNEVNETLSKWLPSETNLIHFWGSDSDVKHFQAFFDEHDGEGFERPDAYRCLGNEVLLIEHFQIDCYKRTKSGSAFEKMNAEFLRKHQKPVEPKQVIHGEVNAANTLAFYYDNACNAFQRHYDRLDDYKNRLVHEKHICKDALFRTCFIIDDITKLGTMAADQSGVQPVSLVLYDRFLDFLEQHPRIDYILTSVWFQHEQYTWFYSHANHDAYVENQISYDQMQFLEHEMQVLLTSTEIDVADIIGEEVVESPFFYRINN